ncbi:MAG: bifunctional folylpolyglutamate synthase/dihydrofolate synthase [Actinobacteria bacterium]|nr:bifunctional folylpolyglutamate synthase/dihydrofolate synthase [Actinomycetota bacterium]
MSERHTYAAVIGRLGESLKFGINPSLEGIGALTDALGRPQDAFACVQVTGTNGKTSVTRMIAAGLSALGRKVGAYTSPHLISYTERFEIDGKPVPEVQLARALGEVYAAAETLERDFTEFELLTAAAFVLFKEHGVEWAVLEVGMGGKWDATSVVVPKVAVITGVGLDHTDRLGSTREEIAADKAHIIKNGSIAVVGPGCVGVESIFEERAAAMRSPYVLKVGVGPNPDVTWRIVRRPRTPDGTLTVDVSVHGVQTRRATLRAPSYQAPNIATAMAAVGVAVWDVGDGSEAEKVAKSLRFPGRFELLRSDPPLVVDGAHNPEAAGVLASAIDEAFDDRKPVIVLAILADKDAEGIVRALAPAARAFVVTENGSVRCMPAAELAAMVQRVTGAAPRTEPTLERALLLAAEGGSPVVATGSLYTAGAVKALLAR